MPREIVEIPEQEPHYPYGKGWRYVAFIGLHVLLALAISLMIGVFIYLVLLK